ncbi:MAG TPA: hypothetical protein VFB12_08640 [Ktedonobacteraceae bacterium]|nr:hypothetical protein [Ktedonobacteraceae bacterium]
MISQMGSATHSCCWLFLLIRISLSPTPMLATSLQGNGSSLVLILMPALLTL